MYMCLRVQPQGHFDGSLVVRDEEGSKRWSCQLGAAVWVVAWSPFRREADAETNCQPPGKTRTLVACTFEPRVWIFAADEEKPVGSADLSCDPLSIAFAPQGEVERFFCMGLQARHNKRPDNHSLNEFDLLPSRLTTEQRACNSWK